MADWLSHTAAFIAGGTLAWAIRGVFDRAALTFTTRVLVEAVGKENVEAAIKRL